MQKNVMRYFLLTGYCATIKRLKKEYVISNNIIPSLTDNKFFSSKDVTVDTTVAKISSPDILMRKLKTASNTDDVLQLVSEHNKIMNRKHLMQSLRSLFSLQKSGCTKLSTEDILNNSEFKKLCRNLKYSSRGIEINEIIEALKVISYVGVSGNSTIIQVLLQLIRQQINHLSLHQIIFTDFLISQFEKSPLVDALKIAFPLVFDIHLPLEVDRDNVNQLCDCLYFASKRNCSELTIDLLISLLQKKTDEIDTQLAKSIIWSLCDMNPENECDCRSLIEDSIKIIIKGMSSMTYKELQTTLDKLMFKKWIDNSTFYNADFLDALVDYFISHDLKFGVHIWLLKRINLLDHSSIKLINYIVDMIVKNPEIITTIKPVSVLHIIRGLSNVDHNSITHWDKIRSTILDYKGFSETYNLNIKWVYAAVELASMDMYHPHILKQVSKSDYLSYITNRDHNKAECQQLLLLNEAMKLLHGEENFSIPDNVIEKCQANIAGRTKEFPLQYVLEKALGGSSYVKTKLESKSGYFIDHVILMRKGGYPIAFNNVESDSKTHIEDFLDYINGENQVVTVFAFSNLCYTLGAPHLKSHFTLLTKVLEAQGITVIPISLLIWNQLGDFEKIPYLMQTIRSKTEEKQICNIEQ